MPGIETNRGAKRAREARVRWGLDDGAPLPCVLTVAEHHGGVPVIVAALPRGCAGACVPGDAGGRRVLWINGGQVVVRQRFTVAHELGHVVCGHGGDRALVDTPASLADPHEPREVQANAFAAELLAPAEGVRALVPGRRPSLEAVVRVALTYGISTVAALFRLRTLRLVAPAGAEVLRGELAECLDEHVRRALAAEVAPVDDVLAAITALPRLPASLEGSALAATLRGEVSVAAGARAADAPAAAFAAAVAHLAHEPVRKRRRADR